MCSVLDARHPMCRTSAQRCRRLRSVQRQRTAAFAARLGHSEAAARRRRAHRQHAPRRAVRKTAHSKRSPDHPPRRRVTAPCPSLAHTRRRAARPLPQHSAHRLRKAHTRHLQKQRPPPRSTEHPQRRAEHGDRQHSSLSAGRYAHRAEPHVTSHPSSAINMYNRIRRFFCRTHHHSFHLLFFCLLLFTAISSLVR